MHDMVTFRVTVVPTLLKIPPAFEWPMRKIKSLG